MIECGHPYMLTLGGIHLKVAFFAFQHCSLGQSSMLLTILHQQNHMIHTLTVDGKCVTSDSGICIQPNGSLEWASPRDYQLLILSAESLSNEFVQNAHLIRFLRQFAGGKGWIAACGAAPQFLATAGLLGGLRFTADETTLKKQPEAFRHAIYANTDVCIDGNVISARSASYLKWTLLIAKRLNLAIDTFQTKYSHYM